MEPVQENVRLGEEGGDISDVWISTFNPDTASDMDACFSAFDKDA